MPRLIRSYISNPSRRVHEGALAGQEAESLAFTLIELLVVVAIIAILAGLLLPALSRATMAARATECRGNLHDMGLALRMYADEFDQYPTYSGRWTIVEQSDEYGWLVKNDWKEDLAPYIGVPFNPNAYAPPAPLRKLRCPQRVRSGSIRANGQYAYNAAGTAKLGDASLLGLGGSTTPPRQALPEPRVQAPAEMVAIGDVEVKPEQRSFWTAGHFDVASPQPWFWLGKSHNAQGNLVFCDGHVETGRQATWVSTNALARARWNNDNQPHPETWAR